MINRDFYDKLPQKYIDVLEGIIETFSDADWFDEAWSAYRQEVLNHVESGQEITRPSYFFNLYMPRGN